MTVANTRKRKFDSLLGSLPTRSGVYRMIDKDGNVLYVGKSRNLKARVSSYFRPTGLATKTMRLVARTQDIQITVTNSETEALLLEQTFIKTHHPPFNVLLRDDKSYPFIRFSNHEFPKIELHRGSKKRWRNAVRTLSKCSGSAQEYFHSAAIVPVEALQGFLLQESFSTLLAAPNRAM